MASEDAKKLIEAVKRARATGDWGAYDGVEAFVLGKSKPAPAAKVKKSSKKEEPKEEPKEEKKGGFLSSIVESESDEQS